jgi:hypothetical protein
LQYNSKRVEGEKQMESIVKLYCVAFNVLIERIRETHTTAKCFGRATG